MTDEDRDAITTTHRDEINKLRKALEFYANQDNYWNAPLSLEINYDRFTLRAVRAAEKENVVLQDWGKVARAALGQD